MSVLLDAFHSFKDSESISNTNGNILFILLGTFVNLKNELLGVGYCFLLKYFLVSYFLFSVCFFRFDIEPLVFRNFTTESCHFPYSSGNFRNLGF